LAVNSKSSDNSSNSEDEFGNPKDLPPMDDISEKAMKTQFAVRRGYVLVISPKGEKIHEQFKDLKRILNDDKHYSKNGLIVFYSATCPHCKKFMPQFLAFATEHQKAGKNIMLGVIDSSENKYGKMAAELGVPYFPFLVTFLDGKLKDEMDARSVEELTLAFDSYFKEHPPTTENQFRENQF